MKTKFLLSAVALTATFAACNNEDIPSSVDMNQPAGEEVVGKTLVSEGGSISLGGMESRVSTDGKWETFDKLALAWYNINQEGITADQLKADWNDRNNYDKQIYANHLFTYNGESKKFETNSNIYQGAHFIYFPYVYSGKVAPLAVHVNAATQDTEFEKDVLNKALYMSAQDFIDAEEVDAETGKLAKNFYITPAVNTLKFNATPEAGISSNDFLKNLEISKLYVWNQDALFNVTATVEPYKIPMVVVENGAVNPTKTYAALKNGLAAAFTSTPVTSLTTNIDADITLAETSALRAFTLPTTAAGQNATWTEIHVSVKADGEAEGTSYNMGTFKIKVKDAQYKDETNQKALKTLQEALYDNTKAYSLQKNFNSEEKLNWVDLNIDLLAADFETDYEISNLEEWNLTVALVDALNSLKAAGVAKTKPEFKLTGDVCVTEGKTINVPAAGMTVNANGKKVCFETDYTVAKALADVFDTSDAVAVKAGATLAISDNVVLVAPVLNEGIINVGYKAQLGDKTDPNVDNTHGRINVVYGSYVNAESNKYGTIAYNVAADEYSYRINNLLATTGNTLGHARVNTLVVNEGITFNLSKADADSPQQDPYEEDSTIGETIDDNLLEVTDIELIGGTLEAGIAKETVKNVKVMASATVSNIKDVNTEGDLTVMKGANVTFDATANALGKKATALISGDFKNEGLTNVYVSIKTTNVYNEKKGQSILSVWGKEVVWYGNDYYQGGMAQGDILRMTGNVYNNMTEDAVISSTSISLSDTYDGKGYAYTVNDKPSVNHLTTGSGSITVTNLTIDGKNFVTTISDGQGGYKSTRAFYFTNAENIHLNNVNVSNTGYAMNINGKDASKTTNKLTVTNSVLKGWSSFDGNFAMATIRNTEFGFNTYFEGGKDNFFNGGIRPYSKTVIEDCTFEEGFYLCVEKLNSTATLTLKNCKVGNTVITKSNYKTLLNIEGEESQLIYLTIE